MRNTFILALVATFMLSCSAQTEQHSKTKEIELTNELDRASYSLGVLVAQNLRQQDLTEVNVDIVAAAIADVLTDAELKMDLLACQTEWQTYVQGQMAKRSEGVKQKGLAFLAENKKREGVIETASGLQYEVLVDGDGPKPGPTDKVKTHYHGTLIDGQVFDSSVDRGEPISFPVNGVIAGWTEALQLMGVGSKWKLFIPSDLAYGDRGAGQMIGPGETLVFEVELLGIE